MSIAFFRPRLLAASMLALVPAVTFAQLAHKPIRIVVPFQAGTGSDVLIRGLAKTVSTSVGQPIIIDNKPGADGAIAASDVQRSKPDGTTLLFASNTTMTGVPAFRKKAPYDPVADFSAITNVGRYTTYLFASADFPAKSVAELLAYAGSKPGQVKYATAHATAKVAGAQFAQLGRLDMVDVPYKGEPASVADLVEGRVQLEFATPAVMMPHVVSGKLRVLATMMPARTAALPQVPTMKEVGMPTFISAGWAALWGPAGMPKDVVAKLNQEFAKAMKEPDSLKTASTLEFSFSSSSPEELSAFVSEQLTIYKEIVQKAGIEIE